MFSARWLKRLGRSLAVRLSLSFALVFLIAAIEFLIL